MTPTNEPNRLNSILLQFIAEYHQGINELAGHGSALDQARAAILKHYIPKSEVIAAIGDDEDVNDTNIVTEYGSVRRGRNNLRNHIREALGLEGEIDHE
jgi:hypothetical protein